MLNFENDKKKKKRKICAKRLCHAIIYPRRYSIFVLDTRVIFILQFYPDKIYPKKKNRVERLNDKNLKTCTEEEKFAETKICYVIIYPEKYLFN